MSACHCIIVPKANQYKESFHLTSEILRGPRNSSLMMTYRKFVVDVAVAFGANTSEAKADVEHMVDLQIQLASVSNNIRCKLYNLKINGATR